MSFHLFWDYVNFYQNKENENKFCYYILCFYFNFYFQANHVMSHFCSIKNLKKTMFFFLLVWLHRLEMEFFSRIEEKTNFQTLLKIIG